MRELLAGQPEGCPAISWLKCDARAPLGCRGQPQATPVPRSLGRVWRAWYRAPQSVGERRASCSHWRVSPRPARKSPLGVTTLLRRVLGVIRKHVQDAHVGNTGLLTTRPLWRRSRCRVCSRRARRYDWRRLRQWHQWRHLPWVTTWLVAFGANAMDQRRPPPMLVCGRRGCWSAPARRVAAARLPSSAKTEDRPVCQDRHTGRFLAPVDTSYPGPQPSACEARFERRAPREPCVARPRAHTARRHRIPLSRYSTSMITLWIDSPKRSVPSPMRHIVDRNSTRLR